MSARMPRSIAAAVAREDNRQWIRERMSPSKGSETVHVPDAGAEPLLISRWRAMRWKFCTDIAYGESKSQNSMIILGHGPYILIVANSPKLPIY